MAKYTSYSDLELAALVKEGDQLAYTEIFERYKGLLYKHAFRFLNDQEEANDIVQELFLTLWQKRESISFTTSLSSYLYCSIRNRIFDLIARKKVASKYLDSIRAFVEKGVYITDEQMRAKELSKEIEKEINGLPKKMREIFELSRNTDLSYKQIGEKLNISDKTVKQQVHNAVKTLRLKINTFLTIFPFL